MSAGELYFKFAFDKAAAPTNDGGGSVPGAWVEQFQCRAGLKFLRGTEPIIAQRLQGVQPVVIKVRVSSRTTQIDTTWRARDVRAGTVFNIRAVTPDDKRAYIDLLAESGVGI